MMKSAIPLLLLAIVMASCTRRESKVETVTATPNMIAELKTAIIASGETNSFEITNIRKQSQGDRATWFVSARLATHAEWGDGGPCYVMTRTHSVWQVIDTLTYDE